MEKNHVYVIENKFTKLCKVGKSNNPSKRINDICNMAGIVAPRIFISSPIVRHDILETATHREFFNKRIVGEWFDESFENLIQFIEDFISNDNQALMKRNRKNAGGLDASSFIQQLIENFDQKKLSADEIMNKCTDCAKSLQMLVTKDGCISFSIDNLKITDVNRNTNESIVSVYVSRYALYFFATKDFSIFKKYKSSTIELHDTAWIDDFEKISNWYKTNKSKILNEELPIANWDDANEFFNNLFAIQQKELFE